MIDKDIEYKSIIMRCDKVNQDAYKKLNSNTVVEYYVHGMEHIWADIQKSAGEFEGYIDEDILSYFRLKFLVHEDQLKHRCIFIKDKISDKYIGTCCAWFDIRRDKAIPVLHWLAVKDEFSNHGYARILIGETLKIFQNLNPGQAIYLHTQPCSYKAIKLYNDFGFCITQKDTYGTALNEFEEAMVILNKHLEISVFNNLKQTSVL